MMDDICRLCCSTNFVNNHIFDEENALYLKMSLYLPIKVFKNDRLPQKVCDKCSCKVNDFYQFCNETIEVQDRLRAVLISTAIEVEDSVDLTLIKSNDLSPLPTPQGMEHTLKIDLSSVVHKIEPNTEPIIIDQDTTYRIINPEPSIRPSVTHSAEKSSTTCEQSTQTDTCPHMSNERAVNDINTDVPLFHNVKVKEEPKTIPPVKMEDMFLPDNYYDMPDMQSDSEDNVSLSKYQKKKRKSKAVNGETERKRKPKLAEWEMLMRALPEGTALTVVDPPADELVEGGAGAVTVKQEPLEHPLGADIQHMKSEPVEFHCCICFVQCYSRVEMLQHYKAHAREGEDAARAPPAAPPPPDATPLKCPRCQKTLERSAWEAHWARHWERDRRPYRCALCEKTFRDHHQILKHGLTHKLGEEAGEAGGEAGEGALGKRYVCDVCPEGFVYMRYLLAHRTRAHPEAAAKALALRCAVCARQFAHLNSLRRHLHAHSGQRNFLCNVCGKALSSREHLKFHIRIHTGYKPNVCKTCGKGFVKKCNLTLHERVHSGEKPHVCAHCGKAFSQRSTLVIHERYHSGARPYSCALCGRGFVAKGLLSMHLKTTCI